MTKQLVGPPEDLKTDVDSLAINLVGSQSATTMQLTLTRAEAAYHLWNLAVCDSETRSDIGKLCLNQALHLLDRGTPKEKHNCLGLMTVLVGQDRTMLEELMAVPLDRGRPFVDRLVGACVQLLGSSHDRSKVLAAEVLAKLAAWPDIAASLESAAGACIAALMEERIDWQGLTWQERQALCRCLSSVLHLLSELVTNPEADPENNALKSSLVRAGVVTAMTKMLKSGSQSCHTSAACCLRQLASQPGFKEQLLLEKCLERVIELCVIGEDEQKAALCGLLWELSADDDMKAHIADLHGLDVLHRVLHAALLASARQKNKGKARPQGRKSGLALSGPPEAQACAIAGTFHHFTFLDEYKPVLRELGCIPLLMQLLKTRNPRVYENATGALWNLGLDVPGQDALSEAGAPSFLAKAVPPGWLVSDLDPSNLPPSPWVSSPRDDDVETLIRRFGIPSAMAPPELPTCPRKHANMSRGHGEGPESPATSGASALRQPKN